MEVHNDLLLVKRGDPEQPQYELRKRTNRRNKSKKQVWTESAKMVTEVHRGQDCQLKSPFLIKKDDPGVPSIQCSINRYYFQKTLYDTGSGVNIMATVTYQLLFRTMLLKPTYIQLQMADQTFQKVEGVVTDVPVKIDDHFVHIDFQVIDMGEDEYNPPIIFGRPFLSTVKAIIYIGTGEVHMYFPSEKVRRYFNDPNYIVEDSKQVRTRKRRRNRNQRRQNIKDGWTDYKGEVVRSEDIQLEQETVAPSQVWKDSCTRRGGAAGTTVYAIQRIPEQLRTQGVPFKELKTPNAVPRGKLGSYHFPFCYLLCLKKLV